METENVQESQTDNLEQLDSPQQVDVQLDEIEADKSQLSDVQNSVQKLSDLVNSIRKEFNLPQKRSYTSVIEEYEKNNVHFKKMKEIKERPYVKQITLNTDREAFMERLGSYTLSFHYLKRPLTPPECAQYGWRNTKEVVEEKPSIDVLVCDDCQNKMYVIEIKDEHKKKPEAIEIIKKYKKGLIECHKEDCQWRTKYCPDTIYNFPLKSIYEGIDHFKKEAYSIMKACTDKNQTIPKIKHPLEQKTLGKFRYMEEHYLKTDETYNQDEIAKLISQQDMFTSASILSSLGWSSLHEEIAGIKCELCFSRKAFHHVKEELDAFNEHKNYCPWINPQTANAITSTPLNVDYKHKVICGTEWLEQILATEFSTISIRSDLSATKREEIRTKLFRFKQNHFEFEDTTKKWKEKFDEILKSKES